MANKNQSFLSVFLNGLIFENPTFVLMLGMCPTLGITTQGIYGVGMGLATTAVLVCSNLLISLLRNFIPEKVRIPAFIVVIATFVTMVEMIMQAFVPSLYKPLAAFIQIYKPAYFERIGLRYVNFFSRRALELESTPYRELIADRYLGIMADGQLAEPQVGRCGVDAEIAIRGGCRVKLHAGPGQVHRAGKSDGEVKFIFDQDLYMPGKIAPNLSAPALQTLHALSWSIFRAAITDELHEAMEPTC